MNRHNSKSFCVLVLDDEYEKMQSIMQVLLDSGVLEESVTLVSTANDARRKMHEKCYDLLILDMNVPPMLGAAPDPSGGINMLKMLNLDDKAKHPRQVIGITAKEGIFADSERQMKLLSWTLCFFDPTSEEWKEVLKEKVVYSIRTRSADIIPLEKFDVVIITALRDTEFEAVLNLPLSWVGFSLPNDVTAYYRGEIKTKNEIIKVVAACTLRMGMPSASALATKMAMLFKPRLISMVGICAGKKGVVSIGDIVVADPVWDWGSGKYKNIKGKKSFSIAPHQLPLDPKFRSKILDIKSSNSILSEMRGEWTSEVPVGQLKIHLGPMASGASVVSDSDIMSDIEQQNRNTIAVEMEAYAVMAAAEYVNQPSPIPIVIKSVCDFGDASKHSKWQKYAAFTSASFFHILLRDHLNF